LSNAAKKLGTPVEDSTVRALVSLVEDDQGGYRLAVELHGQLPGIDRAQVRRIMDEVALEMTRIAKELKYNLVFWSVVDGLVDTQKGTNNSANDPLEALIAIKDLKEKTLILLRDFHLFLQDPNARPICRRWFLQAVEWA
jgi:hypothetical protein